MVTHTLESPKVALITGCSSGFGFLTALELAKAGMHVYASMRSLEKKEVLEDAAKKANITLTIIPLDVTNDKAIEASIKTIMDQEGKIDVLVNNAGICIAGFVEESTMEDFKKMFETNFFGAVAAIKAVLPIMRERKSGRIINVSSRSSETPTPALAGYSATKAALSAFSECLALEAFDEGFFISVIVPGSYRTPMYLSNYKLSQEMENPASAHSKKTKHLKEKLSFVIEKLEKNPNEVAEAIREAATSEKPKLQYIVGKNAKIQTFLKWFLPKAWFQNLLKAFWFKGYEK